MSRAILLAVFIILTLKSSLAAGLSPCPIKQSPPAFDHKSVSLEGVVADLKETTSRAGNDYSTFMLNDKAAAASWFSHGGIRRFPMAALFTSMAYLRLSITKANIRSTTKSKPLALRRADR